MSYKAYPTLQDAEDAAEAVARLWAAENGRVYTDDGMPPGSYSKGKQPEPREAYYQRWYAPPKASNAAIPADPANGIPAQPARPARLDVDPFMAGKSGQTVQIHGGRQVTLNFQGLQEE